jgi:hypothetical protein
MTEMMDELDVALRDVLAADAATYDVPASLAERTLDAVRWSDAGARRRRADAGRGVGRGRTWSRPWAVALAAVAVVAVVAGGVVVVRATTRDRAADRTAAGVGARAPGTTTAPAGQTQANAAQGMASSASASSGAAGGGAAGAVPAPPAPASLVPAPPAIVRSAEVNVQVDRGRFADRWREANDIPARHGGFVTNSAAETIQGDLARGTLTARIPVAALDTVVRELRGLGTPTRVSDAGHDVSPELVDFDARIRNAQAREIQLLDLLKGTRTAAAVREIQAQLGGARAEIEGLQTQRARLQAEVDLATLQVSVTEPLHVLPPPPKGRWSVAVHDAGDAVVTVLTALLVAGGYATPIVVLAGLVWSGRRRVRRRGLER